MNWSPLAMMMPGRKFEAVNGYRYGFNGKENDNEVNGEGDQQDYGMRIYDPRLGRFLSLDPLTKKYPELTPYQFASNRPIDGVDLDGMEFMGKVKKLDYDGSGWDYLRALENVARDLVNMIPEVWNSAVVNYQSLRRGTWTKDFTGELKQMGNGVKDYAVNSWNYTVNTPIKQQLTDTWNTIKDPRTLEMAVVLIAGSKIKLPNIGSVFRFTTVAAERVAGTWIAESTAGWSQAAIEYQEYVTGVKAGTAFNVNGVKFDGIRGNTLLEAKNSYNKLL